MTQFQCHYQSLKVTRDAPLEVIRAAYRSLSQKHHPDKHSGNPEAARMMSRLNFAYSVLSDPDQRELYDLQMLHEQRARQGYAFQEPADAAYDGGEAGRPADVDGRSNTTGPATNSLLHRIRLLARGRNSQIAGMAVVVFVVALVLVVWSTWREHQSMALLEHAALPVTGTVPSGPAAVVPQAVAGPAVTVAQVPVSAEPSAPVPVPKAPDAPAAVAKSSEFERLSAMLKSMGLGLHKLDLSTQPATTRPPAAKPAEPEKPAVAASANPAPPARVPAASAVAATETARAREESERPAVPDTARAEAKSAADGNRANAAPATTANAASASAAPLPAVTVDMRTCAPPTYPANAYSNGESGTVQLALLVGSDGRVIESKVQKSSGYSELNKAARKALSQCRFKVPNGDRQAEPVWTTLEYVFKLD